MIESLSHYFSDKLINHSFYLLDNTAINLTVYIPICPILQKNTHTFQSKTTIIVSFLENLRNQGKVLLFGRFIKYYTIYTIFVCILPKNCNFL